MKKKKPLLWVAGAVVAVAVVGGAVGGSENASDDKESPEPSFPVEVSAQPTESASPSPVPSQSPSTPPVVTVTYVASTDSDKCHTERCRFAGGILEENIIYFHSKEEAINAGYSACGSCKPW